jgi:hypothetical protein
MVPTYDQIVQLRCRNCSDLVPEESARVKSQRNWFTFLGIFQMVVDDQDSTQGKKSVKSVMTREEN